MSGLLRPHHARHRTKIQTVPHDIGFAAAATVASVAMLLSISGLGIETLERGLRKEEGI
jgi:hypothetical protein